MTLRLGIDVGGTKIACAVVDEAGLIGEPVVVPTRGHDGEQLIGDIVALAREVLAARANDAEPVTSIGMGVAGLIDGAGRTVRFASHLAWRDLALADVVEGELGLPVRIENDATAAAWGEYVVGAGHEADPLLVVTVGTGLGGGLVVNGSLIRGATGSAGEVGHVTWEPEGRLCACGSRGCLEQYASGSALGRMARELAAHQPAQAAAMAELVDGEVSALGGHHVMAAAQAGDVAAIGLFARMGHILGEGLAGQASVIDPSVIVLGGGVSEAGDLLLNPVRESLNARIIGAGYRPLPEIRLSALGPWSALVGAALGGSPQP